MDSPETEPGPLQSEASNEQPQLWDAERTPKKSDKEMILLQLLMICSDNFKSPTSATAS
jgi:hypothetical protein